MNGYFRCAKNNGSLKVTENYYQLSHLQSNRSDNLVQVK